MSIADTLIKQISAAALPARHAEPAMDDQLPEVDLLPADLFNDAPGLEVFRRREPDSDESFPEQPEGLSVLGTYRWMRSPGLITLVTTRPDRRLFANGGQPVEGSRLTS